MVLADRPATDPRDYKTIGTRPVRPDGVDKVTGRAQYAADISPSRMIFGRILRSPHAHAVIKSIDTSKARALPGVKAVITGADFPTVGSGKADIGEGSATISDLVNNMMANGKVLYRGHAVAAVAATTASIAEEALNLIVIDYDVLPPVLDVRKAMEPDAPILHPNMRTKSQAGPSENPSNVAAYNKIVFGDVEAGFAQSDIVIEREFTTQMVHQGYIEPHSSTAMWNNDGNITIWTSTQGAFSIRDQVAQAVSVKPYKVKVIPLEIGGGFGGKLPTYTDAVAALLSKHAGVPVKVTMNRIEVFEASGPTSGTYVKLKMGITNEGKILAAKWYLAYEAGAFAGSPVGTGANCAMAPYVVPNLEIETFDVVVNKPKVAAYRAPGAPQGTFASESIIDEFAQRLGMDPLELRLKNATHQGDRMPNGQPFANPIGNEEVMRAALHSPHYQSPLPESTAAKKRGRGVAMGYWMNAGLKSSAYAAVNPDGTVSLIEGSTDIGGSRASLAMQFAETLGIPFEMVKPQVVDTDSVGYNDVTGGSRVTATSGMAVVEAANDLIKQLKERAVAHWELSPEDTVEYRDGKLIGPGEGQELTFTEAVARLTRGNSPLVGRATVAPRSVGQSFGCQIADVEVDTETGKVEVLRYTVIQDVGKAIHPSYVEGQMQGGAGQGIGWALNEEYVYDEKGRMLNANFLDYRMATTLDLPMIDTILVEVPFPGHPFGVRGVGETPIVSPLATVANAVSHALDHRFTDLPISPRRILEETLGI